MFGYQAWKSVYIFSGGAFYFHNYNLDRVKRIWYLSPMWAAKVQASLRIRAVSPEPSLLAHTSSESRGTFRQKARSLASLNGWACAVKICHDGMLEDTNSLTGLILSKQTVLYFSEICFVHSFLKNDKILSDTKIGSDQLCIVLLCYLNGVIGYVLITSAQWLLILSHYKQIRIDGRCKRY